VPTAHTTVWTGSVMILWGANASTPVGGRYHRNLGYWDDMSLVDAPSATGEQAVWTGTRMLTWASDGTGGAYNPGLDEWTPMGTEGAPEPRSAFSVVWTSSEMIVWGGVAGSETVATGGLYDADEEEWLTPTQTENAPCARTEHTAVWTGSEMIIWGGAWISGGNDGVFGTGARYTP
jgi:hypothetical protein